MATKTDKITPVSGMKDPLPFPTLIIGRDPQKKEQLDTDVSFFRRTYGYRDTTVHAEKVHCFAWNKEGTLLATGSYDKTVVLWSFKDGKLAREYSLKGHGNSVDQLAWNPMISDQLVTCSCDKTVKVWNTKNRGIIYSIQVRSEVINLSWAPDGKTFVFGDKDDTLTFCDPDKGAKFEKKFSYEVNEMVFFQRKEIVYLFLATGTPMGYGGRLEYFEYKFPELQSINSVPVSGQTCVALELDPAGKFLAIGSNDANVTLWDLNGLFPVQEVTRQQQPVRSMSFNQDGRFIATCTEEHYVDIALVETGEKVWSFQSDEREKDLMNLVGVAFHPKRPVLACAYDVRDRNHRDRDNSIIRIFGVAPGSETEKDKRKESKREPRARSREREKEKDIAGKLADDDAKPKDMPKSPEKPRFESKFSFLRATPDQIIALEKRKTEQAARDAKAAAIAAQRAAAAAAKLPTRVPTRLGVQSQPGARSGIRQPIRPPEVPAASRSSSASHREESSGSGRSRQSGGTKKDEERKNMPPPTGNPSSSSSSREGNQSRTSSHSRNAEADEGGPERKRMRSVTKESDSKDQRGSSGRSESKK